MSEIEMGRAFLDKKNQNWCRVVIGAEGGYQGMVAYVELSFPEGTRLGTFSCQGGTFRRWMGPEVGEMQAAGLPWLGQVRQEIASGRVQMADRGSTWERLGSFGMGLMTGNSSRPKDKDDRPAVAAAGLVLAAWRNGPLEDAHHEGIPDGDMMRLNVKAWRIARDHLGRVGEEGQNEEAWAQWRGALAQDLLDIELDSQGMQTRLHGHWVEFEGHLQRHLDILVGLARRSWGAANDLLAANGQSCRWFGLPGWNEQVDAFIDLLGEKARASSPGRCGELEELRLLLQFDPDQLTQAEASWCVAKGLNYVEGRPLSASVAGPAEL